jgi:hypothetical protein
VSLGVSCNPWPPKYQFVDGHYLNLPVVEEDGKLVAIVDVLKLTYATLEQVCGQVIIRKTDLHLHVDEHYECRSSWGDL